MNYNISIIGNSMPVGIGDLNKKALSYSELLLKEGYNVNLYCRGYSLIPNIISRLEHLDINNKLGNIVIVHSGITDCAEFYGGSKHYGSLQSLLQEIKLLNCSAVLYDNFEVIFKRYKNLKTKHKSTFTTNVEFEKNIISLKKYLLNLKVNKNLIIVVIGINYCRPNPPIKRINKYNTELNCCGLNYINVSNDYSKLDGVHLDGAGHLYLFNEIKRIINSNVCLDQQPFSFQKINRYQHKGKTIISVG